MTGLLDFLQSASNSVASNVTAPVDGIAWLLRKAGIPVPDAPVGGSDWAQNAGLTRPVQQSGASLAGESLGMIAPMLIAAKAPQVARGLLQGADNLMAPRTMNPQTGAIVWHGSPHKFDKFDASKIGTGEGAQAYGHGLYLAESPDVASSYTKMNVHGDQLDSLSPSAKKFVREQMFSGVGSDDILKSAGMSKKQAARWDAEDLAAGKSASRVPYINAMEEVESFLAKTPVVPNNGALYKVDLPDEQIAKMLDWDKPLSQQAPEVQAALANTKNKHLRAVVDYASSPYSTPGLESEVKTMGEAIKLLGMNQSPAKGSQMLAKQGIPGIRYLDGGSRGTGAGTSNFVVFPGNEGLLSILERNGQALPKKFTYPQDKALATAQRNAALPIEQGGLGLGPENTAMERARALGFDTEGVHTSRHGVDVKELDSGKYAMAPFDAIGTHFGTKEAALDRFNRTVGTTEQFKGSTYPVMLDGSKPLMNKQGAIFNEEPLLMSLSEKADYGNLPVSNAAQREQIFSKNSIIPYINDVEGPGSISYIAPPKSIRSRFAAFDPMRRNEADLLGRADPELLGLLSAGLLGYGGYNALSKP